MLCPKCHNNNPDTNLTCDFCMAVLPIDEKRQLLIDKKNKLERSAKFKNSYDKLIGLIFGLVAIILIVIIGIWLF